VAAVIAERRAQPTASIDAERRGLLDDGLRAFLHKEIQVALDESGATRRPEGAASSGPVRVTAPAEAGEGGALVAMLTQRVAMLEAENRQLRERASGAEAAARGAQAEAKAAQSALATERASLADKESGLLAALKSSTEELTRTGERQAAADRRRALETDNVRQAYRAERDALAGRVAFLEEELKTARTAVDAYRRARAQ
jgi:hypothetical protein